METFRDIAEWLAPPSSAWWYLPMAGALLTAQAAGIMLACWPIRLFPRTLSERRWARRPGWLRLAPVVLIGVLAIGALAAGAALCLGPRRPRALVLQTSRTAFDPTFWDRRIPPRDAGWSRLDARPLVANVLAASLVDGAEHWYDATPGRVRRLRELCRLALTGRLRRPTTPGAIAASVEQVPAWVVECVELTIVQGLLLRENIAWAGIRLDAEERMRWERAARLLGSPRRRWQLEVDDTAHAVRVRQLFDGRREGSGRVSCRVLVQGPPHTTAELRFAVWDDLGMPVAEFGARLDLTRGLDVREIAGLVPPTARPGPLVIAAERGAVRTWLPPADASPIVLAVQGPGAGDLVRAWDAVRRDDHLALEAMLRTRGRPPIRLEARAPAPGMPSVVLRPDSVLVLAPGLDATDIPGDVWNRRPLTAADSGGVANASVHVAHVAGVAATAESWMSASLRTAGMTDLPVTADSMRPMVSGGLLNQGLEAGRLLREDLPIRDLPVLEIGRAAARPFLVYRFDVREQGLVRAASSLPADYFEPARSRAFFASLAWAVERVLADEVDDRTDGDCPHLGPLLTLSDQDGCTEHGRRPTDAVALAALGAAMLVLMLAGMSGNRDDSRPAPFTRSGRNR